jgi:hypothetical protein
MNVGGILIAFMLVRNIEYVNEILISTLQMCMEFCFLLLVNDSLITNKDRILNKLEEPIYKTPTNKLPLEDMQSSTSDNASSTSQTRDAK